MSKKKKKKNKQNTSVSEEVKIEEEIQETEESIDEDDLTAVEEDSSEKSFQQKLMNKMLDRDKKENLYKLKDGVLNNLKLILLTPIPLEIYIKVLSIL